MEIFEICTNIGRNKCHKHCDSSVVYVYFKLYLMSNMCACNMHTRIRCCENINCHGI